MRIILNLFNSAPQPKKLDVQKKVQSSAMRLHICGRNQSKPVTGLRGNTSSELFVCMYVKYRCRCRTTTDADEIIKIRNRNPKRKASVPDINVSILEHFQASWLQTRLSTSSTVRSDCTDHYAKHCHWKICRLVAPGEGPTSLRYLYNTIHLDHLIQPADAS